MVNEKVKRGDTIRGDEGSTLRKYELYMVVVETEARGGSVQEEKRRGKILM